MNKEVFKSIHTTQELEQLFQINQSFMREHCISGSPVDIQGSDLNGLSYYASTSRDGLIRKNYFIYKDPETRLVGLAEASCCSSDIKPVTTPRFMQLEFITDKDWLVRSQDGLLRVLSNYKESKSAYESVDILRLGSMLFFYQLDGTDGTRSLACYDNLNQAGGLYYPFDEADFTLWYKSKVIKYGSEGSLDDTPVSALFKVYYEVIRSIFMTAEYKAVVFD